MSVRPRRVGNLDGAYDEASLIRSRHKASGLGAHVKTGFDAGEKPLSGSVVVMLVAARIAGTGFGMGFLGALEATTADVQAHERAA
jgi:hypothetical protein